MWKFAAFTGAAGGFAKHAKSARALIGFPTAPKNAPVIKAKGMEPG